MDKICRFGWYALVIAMIGDILISLVLPCFYKEYNIMKMSISALGNPHSPVRVSFNVWMLIEGLLFLAAIPALYRMYYSVSAGLTNTMILFIAIFAIGACIFTCFFSVNESRDIVTTASKIHGIGRGNYSLIEPYWKGLFRFASDSEPKVRLTFIWASENIATNTPDIYKDHMPVFESLLHDTDDKVRMESPEIFRVLGKRRPEFVIPYIEQLQEMAETDSNRVVRIHSLGAIKATMSK